MKITIVTGPFHPTPPAPCGAVERRWTQSAECFVKLGHETTIISRQHEMHNDNEVVEGVKHVRVKGVTRTNGTVSDLVKDFIYSVRVFRMLPEADILVTNVFWLPVLISMFSSGKCGKVVVNVARFPKQQMRLYRRCARLLAVSSAISDSIIEQFPRAESFVRVIVNPVNTDVFTPPEQPRRTKQERTILYTGRVHPEKGLHLLIDAFAELHKEFPHLKLKLLGQQETKHGGGGKTYIDKLKKQAGELPVEFAEPLFDIHKLAAEIQKADYYCYPSMAYYGEACPVAPLEAMATGLSPVVSDLPQFDDYIEDGHNGYIFKRLEENASSLLAEKLRLQITDDARADAMGQAAYERAKAQGTMEVAKRYLEDFEEILRDIPFDMARQMQKPLHDRLRTKSQPNRFKSSWSLGDRITALLWWICSILLFKTSPKQLVGWRIWLLRRFGCQINGRPFISPSARIKFPWLLRIDDRACIGPHAEVYNLGPVWLKERSVVTQYVYLCAGTHDLKEPELPLVVGPIIIGREAFIGAKAVILPGVIIGDGAVLGAGCVLAKDAEPWTIYAGNPGKKIREREFNGPRTVEDGTTPASRLKWMPQS